MAKGVQDTARDLFSKAVENIGTGGRGRNRGRDLVSRTIENLASNGNNRGRGSSGGLSGMRGMAAGAGVAALVPVAMKAARGGGLKSLASSPGKAVGGITSQLGDKVGGGIGDKVSEKVDEAGGASGILKDTVKDALPFGSGSGGGSKGGAPGVGKGRRMPVQQSVEIGAPTETVYNQWTQFEDWPNFMHRVTRVTQEDECTVSFATKIWGKTKEFTAKIDTQRPDERIKWRVSQGLTHQGVVTFHELGPNLTRVLLSMDVEPGGMLEKAARGMRHVKRAARADLHRFKAFVEMNEQETGAWRGLIEDGELVEEHDPEYDEDREYADIEAVTAHGDDDSEEDEDSDEGDEDQEEPEAVAEEEQGEDDEEEGEPAPRRRASSQGSSSRGRGSRSSSDARSRAQNSQSS